MHRWIRPGLAAGGTLGIILGIRFGGLLLEPEIDGSPPDINGFAWLLSLIGVYLLVRAAGGHGSFAGLIVSITGIVLLSSPFWGGTMGFFLIVLPLTAAAIGSVIISAAASREPEPVLAETAAPPATGALSTVASRPGRTVVRQVMIALGATLVLAAIAAFLFFSYVISQIPMGN